MKKSPFILSLLTVIYSCNNSTPAPTGKDNAATIPGHEALTTYQQWISSLDNKKIDNASLALRHFEQAFHQQPADICDSAFAIFDRFHEQVGENILMSRNMDSLNAIATAGTLYTPDSGFKPEPLSPAAKKLKDTMSRNGFRVGDEEGSPVIIRDYASFGQEFKDRLSPAMKEYFTQLIREDREGFQNDAALCIPPDSLAARAVWWEAFIRLHPKSIYSDKAAGYELVYRATLINGMDNTPVERLDKPNGLDNYYAEAYSFIEVHYPNSPINAIISAYHKAWQANDIATIHRIREKNSFRD